MSRLLSGITQQRELESSFFVVMTEFNDNDNMMVGVGGGLRGELCHGQGGHQVDGRVVHISGTRASIFIPFFCGDHWVQ